MNPRTGNVIQIGVGAHPEGIAAHADQVWVANYNDHTLTRISPRSSRRVGKPLRVAPNPYAIALNGDSLWVTCVGANRVIRVRLAPRASTRPTAAASQGPEAAAITSGATRSTGRRS